MRTRHHRRVSRKAAEQLLGGSGAVPDAEPLARVLAAASAPARDSELAGEQAAMAAFEAHHLVPEATSRRGQMIKSPLARLLTAKVIAASVAVFATGGVALAASTGALTGSGSAGAGATASRSPGSGPARALGPATATASASASVPGSGRASPSAPASASAPVPSAPVTIPGTLVGLCHALVARAGGAASPVAAL